MMAATMLGEFVHVPGVIFQYRCNAHPFFNWQCRGGPISDAAQLARRSVSLARLVWHSRSAVSRVAGVRYGLLAGYFALSKVLRQIGGYVVRHHLRRPGGLTQP